METFFLYRIAAQLFDIFSLYNIPVICVSCFTETAKKDGCAVLVHCQGGVSRSAAITIAYLMYHLNLSLKDAYKFVKDKRSCVAPNLNFMGQLMEFEKQLRQNQK